MKKWEYKAVNSKLSETELNTLGMQGVGACFTHSSYNIQYIWRFWLWSILRLQKRKIMSSVIQKYKKLYKQLEELKYEKGHLFIDLDLHVSSRKNFKLWLSTIHNDYHKGVVNSMDRSKELPEMIKNKSKSIAHYLQKIKKNKKKTQEVKKKLSMLVK